MPVTRVLAWCKQHLAPVHLSSQGALLSVSVLVASAIPLLPSHLAQFEALNRELGKLCGSHPPRQALTVCKLHAQLVRAF
jgi:hypothetical protein